MRNGIPEFRPRQPLDRQLSSTTLNDIRRELESLRITRVVNGTFRKLPGGTEIVVPRAGGGGGGSSLTRHPFQISSTPNPDNEDQYFVTVRPGTINSLLPSDIFDGPSLARNTIAANSLSYVVLDASSDGQQITTASVSVESSAPSAQTPEIFGLPSSAQFLLGVVHNSNVFQVQFTNLVVTGKQQFIASKSSPAAVGELPYEIYYVWG
jgi:hypothetical protein